MAPKPIGIIISEISSSDNSNKINKLFLDNLSEIFSHPKVDITNHLVHFNAKEVESLREFLLENLCKTSVEKLQLELEAFGKQHDLESVTLRKRYKETGCHDDIYTLGISIENSTLHKDFSKIIELSKKKKKEKKCTGDVNNIVPSQGDGTNENSSLSGATAAGGNHPIDPPPLKDVVKKKDTKKDNPGNKNPPKPLPSPLLNDKDAILIHHMTEIKNIVTLLQQENKALNNKINLLTTKVDQQTKEITLLRTNSKQNGLSNQHHVQQQQQQQRNLQQQRQQQIQRQPQLPNPTQQQGDTHALPRRQTSDGLVSHPAASTLAVSSTATNESQSNTATLASSIAPPDNEAPFTPVSYRRPRQPVFGSKARTENSIAGQRVVREVNVFVGGVSHRITEELLHKHIEEEMLVTPIKVTHNKSNNYNQSFKVTVNNADKNTIFNPESWDENIILKPFKEKEIRNNQNNYRNRSRETYNRGVYQNWKDKPFSSRWDEQGNSSAANGNRFDNMDNNMNSQYADSHYNINLI